MVRRQFTAGIHAILAIICLAMPLADESKAAEYPNPDLSLDSLVYQSDLVIEGRLVESKKDPAANNGAVRITAVYRGSAKVGDTVLVIGIGNYQKPSGSANSNISLEPKDDLILFLTKTQDVVNSAPFADNCFTPLPGNALFSENGVRLVLRGGIYDFLETTSDLNRNSVIENGQSNPPYVANVGPVWPGGAWNLGLPVLPFRAHLRESAARAADRQMHLYRSPVADDISWLISLLKQRYQPPPPPPPDPNGLEASGFYFDRVAADAAKRLAELRDFPAMVQGIGVNPDQANDFSQAFATPKGRDFLLETLKNRELTIPHRKLLIHLMEMGGLVYSPHPGLSLTKGPYSWDEQISYANGFYLTRIAQVAADLSAAGDDDVANALLTLLNNPFSGRRAGDRHPQIDFDLEKAADVLRQLYDRKNVSSEIRFRVENVMFDISEKEYATLQSACGLISTLAEPGNVDAALPRIRSQLLVSFDGLARERR